LDHLSPKDSNGSSNKDVIATGIDEQAFMEGISVLAISGLTPGQISDLFCYLDRRNMGVVSLDRVVEWLRPPSTTMLGVVEKMGVRARELAQKGLTTARAFEAADEELTGRLTRLQFKEALVDLGFVLVDEPLIPGMRGGTCIRSTTIGGLEEDEKGEGDVLTVSEGVWDMEERRRGKTHRAAELKAKRDLFERRLQVGDGDDTEQSTYVLVAVEASEVY